MDYQKSYVLMWLGDHRDSSSRERRSTCDQWLAAVGVLILLAGILQTFLFFRCPHCGGLWDTHGGVPHYCPHCGEYIW